MAGLPESVFATEGFAFLNDLLFSGILFCLLPTLFLVPKLYGKIEPLLGMAPRTEKTWVGRRQPQGGFGLCHRLCGGCRDSAYRQERLLHCGLGS